jgi:predicted murein hydrolase (TIGR00659 family)
LAAEGVWVNGSRQYHRHAAVIFAFDVKRFSRQMDRIRGELFTRLFTVIVYSGYRRRDGLLSYLFRKRYSSLFYRVNQYNICDGGLWLDQRAAGEKKGEGVLLKWMIAAGMILLTLVVYYVMVRVYQRFYTPFLIPILTSILTIIVLLAVFGVSYETYMIGGRWIDLFLGPAVVALAYPLYKQKKIVQSYFVPMIGGVLAGSIIGMVSGLQFAKWLGVTKKVYYAVLPKSVTTPVAMEIAEVLGGTPPLAAVFVMIAGIGGVVVGPYVLRWSGINSYLGRGIGFGSASHGIGTSKAFEYGEDTAAVSSVAMTLSAISVSVLGPLLVLLFYS